MMKRLLPLLALALTATSVFAAEPVRYMITTRTTTAKGQLKTMSNVLDVERHAVHTFENFNALAATLTAEEVAALKATGEIETITPVVERHIFSDDVPPVSTTAVRYNLQQVTPWGLTNIAAPDVWPVTTGAEVNVAVIDTGIDFNHLDLAAAYAGGYNVFSPAAAAMDDHRHGTHVAGTIAATDNNFGVVGVSPNVKLWGVKVLDRNGRGTDETLSKGIDWVISKARETGGRWVINMSLGARMPSPGESAAVSRALVDGIVVIAAAGNTGLPFINYPAGHRGVVAVGAVDVNNKSAKFSTGGSALSVVAPGVSVPSTFVGGMFSSADIARNDVVVEALGIKGSPFGEATARLVDCGLGAPEDIPASVDGKVALIKRGVIPFREKARNAKEAGAVAVIIYNNEAEDDVANWTMFKTCTGETCEIPPEWENYVFPITIGVTMEEGEKLQAWLDKTVTAGFRTEDYGNMSGTSMATPHVAGAAALLLSIDPDLNPAQVALVLEKTATDLLEPGWDGRTGWGLINVHAAAKYVAPELFGLPPNTPETDRKRRGARH